MTTAGEARARLQATMVVARARSSERRLKDYRETTQTEGDLCLLSFDDGWDAGYMAGFQQALDSVQGALGETIKAQRSGIMATP